MEEEKKEQSVVVPVPINIVKKMKAHSINKAGYARKVLYRALLKDGIIVLSDIPIKHQHFIEEES